MRAYIRFVTRYHILLKLFLIVLFVFAVTGVRQVQLSKNFNVFVPNESVYNDRLVEMGEDFASKDQLIIQLAYDELTMTEEVYGQLVDFNGYIHDNFEGARMIGPVQAQNGEEITDKHITEFQSTMDMMVEMAPYRIHEDKAYYIFTLFSEEKMEREDLLALEKFLDDAGYDYAISGDAYVQLQVFGFIQFILMRIPPMALGIILLTFYFQLRTVKGTLLSVLPAGASGLLTMGIVGHFGNEVSIITALAPIFTIVIGSADGLHFITHIQEEQRRGKKTEDVLTHTLQMIGVPMIITTVTSIVGFLALMVMDTSEIIVFAISASLGVLLAGILTWYLLPLMLCRGMQLGYSGKHFTSQNSAIKRFWGKPVIAVILTVLVVFALGAGRIKQEFNMLSVYKSHTEVYKYTTLINEVNGGSLPLFIYGDMPSEYSQLEMMDSILEYEEGLRGLDAVGKVVSAADMFETFKDQIPTGLSQGDGNGSQMPSLQSLLQNSDLQMPAAIEMIGEFINPGAQKFRIMVFPTGYENDLLREIQNYVDDQSDAYSDYNMKLTGASLVMMELNETMLGNQITSSIIAIVVVFLLLLISLRHFKASMVSLLPIILTLLFLFGMMGLLGISLNIVTTTIFSITIGVGIDYAIHFTSVWNVKRREGVSSRNSADFAFRYASRPIVANALGLSLGMSSLFISPLTFHGTVATLMWIAMMSSVIFSLVLLPTVLRKVK